MNPNGATGSIPISVQNANPLLYTLPQENTSVRPYWMVLLQTIVAQQNERIAKKASGYGWYTAWELGVICWLAKANIVIEENVLEPLPYLISMIIGYLATEHSLQTTRSIHGSRFQRSSPRIIAYFIPTYIQKRLILRVKNVNDISKRSCHNQQRIAKLYDIYRKYEKGILFSHTDWLHIGPLLGHIIWFCSIQASCMSAEKATPWNCYAVFGYRLYHYIFPSYFNFACGFLMKCAYRKTFDEEMAIKNINIQESKHKKLLYFDYYLRFYQSVIPFIFCSCLVLPYFLTNVIPMICTYIFMHIIYFLPLFIILMYGGFFMHLPCIIDHRITISSVFIAFSILTTIPVLFSIMFSYSEYLFYGEDYFQTMTDEFNSRYTPTYFKLLQNSPSFVMHTVLNFF
jgi:hypothetical protein